ncbi:MAG: acyl-CoA thioesterase [Actinomycetales bacterium]|nr:acyl-CoA thioesterase [Actinomycetales bacterium]
MTVFRVEVMRRYSDLDPFGHVNNVVYHDYLQEARVWVLVNVLGGDAEDIDQVVARQEVAFLRPLRLRPAPITVETWVSRVGGASYDFSYRILDESGTLCSTAMTQVVFFDRQTEQPRRIPAEVRELLLTHLQDATGD